MHRRHGKNFTLISLNGSAPAILTDQADVLLGKRSKVKDAHSRFANIDAAHLLQPMEALDGLAMVATNMSLHIDAALPRRDVERVKRARHARPTGGVGAGAEARADVGACGRRDAPN